MRSKAPKLIFALIPFLFMAISKPASSDQVTLTPTLSVSEMFDDNLFLRKTNKAADYITFISPGIALDTQSQHRDLRLSYTPSIVRYSRNSQNDTVRHLGTIEYRQDVAEGLNFQFYDSYLKSEDPLDPAFGLDTVRRTRNPYQRNALDASTSYAFGKDSIVTAGYRNYLLVNTDPNVDDGSTHRPFFNYTQWLNQYHGFTVSYDYTIANFSRENGLPQPDYTGHNPILSYLWRLDPQTSGYVRYQYTTRAFDRSNAAFLREDYSVHTFMVGADKQLTAQTSAGLGVGYFAQVPDVSPSRSGFAYNGYLRQRYQRGSFSITGAGGWDEQYLVAENRGFVEYKSVLGTGEYSLLERLGAYGSGGYRKDDYQNGVSNDTWRVGGGFRWSFLRYLYLALDYSHISRTSNTPSNEYDDNRYMLILTGTKPFVWK